jgi:hypothetical protein
MNASRHVFPLMLADAADWYRFTMPGFGSAYGWQDDPAYIAVSFDATLGDLEARLYDLGGQTIGSWTRITGSQDSLRYWLTDLPPGTYFVEVRGVNGGLHPNYSLTIAPGLDDGFEDNDQKQDAFDLNSLSYPGAGDIYFEAELVDSQDWYRIELANDLDFSGDLRFEYLVVDGPLQVILTNSAGTRQQLTLQSRETMTDNGPGERLNYTFEPLTEGTYYLTVIGAEATRDNGDGTTTGLGYYGSLTNYYGVRIDF